MKGLFCDFFFLSHPNRQSDLCHRSQEPRLARVPPIPTRRLFSIPDSSPESSNRWVCALAASRAGHSRVCLSCSRLCLSVCLSVCLSACLSSQLVEP